MDNFYNSPELTDKLISKKTDVVGTMRLNHQEVPSEIKTAKLKKGEHIANFRGKQMLLRWKDKKDFILVSTIHDDSFEPVASRNGVVQNKPVAVTCYNKNMGGVDVADNYLHFYSIVRDRLKKYYMKMFRHLFDMACLNSYVISNV